MNTEYGQKTIKELVQKNQNTIIATKDGHAVASSFFDNGVRPVKTLKTKFGYVLTGTDNHPVWTPHGWVDIKDLRSGDKIAVQPGRLFALRDTITEQQAILYGYLTGDGSCSGKSRGTIELTNIDPDVQTEFATCVSDIFHISTQHDLRNKNSIPQSPVNIMEMFK